MHGIAGPIEPPIGEEVGVQHSRLRALAHAAHVEAAQVESPIVALEREEGEVIALRGQVDHRLPLALELGEIAEVGVPVGVGRRVGHRQAVAPQHLDLDAARRLPGGEVHHVEVAAAIGVLLGQEAEVGDQHETIVLGLEVVLIHRVPGRGPQEEQTAARRCTTDVLREIERGVLVLAGRRLGQRQYLAEALGDVLWRKAVTLKDRLLEAALGLRDEVIHLAWQHPHQIDVNGVELAGDQRDLLLAGQAEHRAAALDAQHRGKGRDPLGLREGLHERIATEGLDAALDPDQEPAVDRRAKAEVEDPRRFLLGRHRGELHLGRLGGDVVAHVLGARVLHLVALVFGAVRIRRLGAAFGQEHRRDRALHDALEHLGGGGHRQDLLNLALRPVGDAERGLSNTEEVGEARHTDLAPHFALRGRPPLLGPGAGREHHLDRGVLLGDGERVRLQEGLAFPAVVVDRERNLGAMAEALGGPGVEQLHVARQIAGVHGMRERQGRDDALHLGVARVLVELRRIDAGGEERRVHRHDLRLELDLGSEELGRELNGESFPDRPVGDRLERQLRVTRPGPGPIDGRRDLNPLGHCLADHRKLGDRAALTAPAEGQRERHRLLVFSERHRRQRRDLDPRGPGYRPQPISAISQSSV